MPRHATHPPAPAPATGPHDSLAVDDAGRYLALKARDARFDGRFFTGVTSTGIYCRPVCRVRTPKPENCRFFDRAAQAEAAGFRPCLRCRPELAPGANRWHSPHAWTTQDASSLLALQAAELMDTAAAWSDEPISAAGVAQRMGISDRHLRRIFDAHWGVSPLQYLQTRRLLHAKQLLTDTTLPVAEIAQLSGYASQRRFHTAFLAHYRLQPTALRKQAAGSAVQAAHAAGEPQSGFTLHAAYRPPLDHHSLLRFFQQRALAGLELVDPAAGTMARTLALRHRGSTLRGVVAARWQPAHHRVELHISAALAPALPGVLARMRAWLDLDADPTYLEPLLAADFPEAIGVRVPGSLDGFELGVRAILGQQITVQAARTLTQRLLEPWGAPLESAWPGLQLCFPDAATVARIPPDALGAMGIVKSRQQALIALARAVDSGTLALHPGAPVEATLQGLLALPGVGPWTAHYIAMRALRWPDAFPAGDVVVQQVLGVRDAPHPARAAEARSQTWRPWRAYATVRAWHSAK
ncbi:DNA-3-methyladenine glycosylase 2 family protein [Rhodoferax bucti]|uniref:DNA-3-methyladenine glycosylase 2 family protein n=1 Tax=Rhodoferax bucti TaxID=2576305 RepID=UPI0011099650|nr:Ada metal-binding domain-containing protein [Rhodoferax bucti]